MLTYTNTTMTTATVTDIHSLTHSTSKMLPTDLNTCSYFSSSFFFPPCCATAGSCWCETTSLRSSPPPGPFTSRSVGCPAHCLTNYTIDCSQMCVQKMHISIAWSHLACMCSSAEKACVQSIMVPPCCRVLVQVRRNWKRMELENPVCQDPGNVFGKYT